MQALNLDTYSTSEPLNKLVLTIIKNAISVGADAILLELDLELHTKVEKVSEAIRAKYRRPDFYEAIFRRRFKDYFCYGKSTVEKMFFELGQLPNALKVTHIINGVEEATLSARGSLFEDITQILLVTAGVPAKTTGEVSAVIETIKPVSKWIIECEKSDTTNSVKKNPCESNTAILIRSFHLKPVARPAIPVRRGHAPDGEQFFRSHPFLLRVKKFIAQVKALD